jgi:tRNA (adenine57-N1/adenine58-N1)-methyltransferase catalytic subunit
LSAEAAASGPDGMDRLLEGELVLVRHRPNDSSLFRLRRGPFTVEGKGVVDLTAAIGARPGVTIDWAGTPYRVVRPSLVDLLAHLRRRAQIVTPKDAQHLLLLAGVGPGSRVVEAGAGSGALTTVLAHAVGPAGRVITYDRRPDFLEVARKNVTAAGLEDRVEFRLRDVTTDGLDVPEVGSLVLDLPEPWAVLPSAVGVLVIGASIALYTPTYNQLERSVRELKALGFEEVRSLELLERALHVGDGGTRPEFEMLGHTGFLTGARWMGGPW